jgi:hypothetical protein
MRSASPLLSYESVARAASVDWEIARTAARKVPFLTEPQIRRTWFADERAARRALNRLCGHGWLAKFRVCVHPERAITEPLATWAPGRNEPDFGAIAYKCQARFAEPLEQVSVYRASVRAARYFAGFGGRLKRPLQATHDLHVAAIYLHFLRTRPIDAKAWVSEDSLAPSRRHQKLPDAMLQFTNGRPPIVIEFGGAYRAERVKRFHEDCARRGLEYELW